MVLRNLRLARLEVTVVGLVHPNDDESRDPILEAEQPQGPRESAGLVCFCVALVRRANRRFV